MNLQTLTGSTVLGFKTSEGRASLPDAEVVGAGPALFPALLGGVLDPLDPFELADPAELALLALLE